jgi:hypothetical protein
MTPNEIISKARGECRHVFNRGGYCNYCHKSDSELDWHLGKSEQDYSTDPSAWDSELYEWIEERVLNLRMVELIIPLDCFERGFPDIRWHILKSTPAQKAEALSKAIREVEDE